MADSDHEIFFSDSRSTASALELSSHPRPPAFPCSNFDIVGYRYLRLLFKRLSFSSSKAMNRIFLDFNPQSLPLALSLPELSPTTTFR